MNMMGGDSQKSDSFPSTMQYRLDFSNTEREKKKREKAEKEKAQKRKKKKKKDVISNFWEKTPNHRIILVQLLMQAYIFIQSTRIKALLS